MQPSATAPRRIGIIALAVLISPVLVATGIVALPAIAVLELRRLLERRRTREAFEAKWGRHGMRFVIAYSDDSRWAHRIEQEWLPRIGRQSVILDWKARRGSAADAPLEARLFEQYAGRRDFDPMIIVVPPAGPVRTLRFRDAFVACFGGEERALAEAESHLFGLAESLRDARAIVVPDGVLQPRSAVRRNA